MSFLCVFTMAVLLALASSKPTIETDIVTEILKTIDGRDEMWRVVSYLKESRDDLVKELPLVSPEGNKLSYTFFAPTSFAFTMQTPQDTVDPLFVDDALRKKVLIRHFARQSISSDDLAKLDKLVMADSTEVELSGKSGIEVCDLPAIENTGLSCYAAYPSFTFNSKSGKCEAYVYGGCLKTENLFDTEEACVAKCGPTVNTRSKVIRDAQIQPESVQLPQNFGVVYFVDRVFMDGEEVNTAFSDHFKRHPNTALCLGLPCSPEAPIDVDVTAADEPALDIRETPLAPPPDSPILDGGYSVISSNEPVVKEIVQFAISALSQGANKASPFVLVNVVKAESQVVAGFNYRLQMELKDNADSPDSIVCNIVVFDQSWTSTRQITSSDCNPPIGVTAVDEPALDIRETPLAPPPDSPILLGGYRDISSNEPDVLEIAEFATSALSQGANKASPFVLSKVVKAERQVVAGFNYRLQIELKDNADSTDSIVCNIVVFDPPGMMSLTSTRQITSSDCNPPIIVPRIETIPELKAEDSS